jgi:hypothetical protein
MDIKLFVGTLRERIAFWDHVDTVANALSVVQQNGIEVYRAACSPTYIHQGREWVAESFLESDATHLCFIDSDMAIHPNSIMRLIEDNLPIVGGLYYGRRDVPVACAFEMTPDNKTRSISQTVLNWHQEQQVPIQSTYFVGDYDDSIIPCDCIGFGLIVIKREVVEVIPEPRFGKHGENLGEDVLFCLNAKEQGYKTYLDMNVQCVHISINGITNAHFRQYNRWDNNDQ